MPCCFTCEFARKAYGDPEGKEWVGCVQHSTEHSLIKAGYTSKSYAKGWSYIHVPPFRNPGDTATEQMITQHFLLVKSNARCKKYSPYS